VILEQTIASTSHATQSALGMQTGMGFAFYNYFLFIIN
jgi:hypothetical protein